MMLAVIFLWPISRRIVGKVTLPLLSLTLRARKPTVPGRSSYNRVIALNHLAAMPMGGIVEPHTGFWGEQVKFDATFCENEKLWQSYGKDNLNALRLFGVGTRQVGNNEFASGNIALSVRPMFGHQVD